MKKVKHISGSERFSAITVFNGIAYLAGQVSQKIDGDISEQANDVFAKIDALLAEINVGRDNMLNAQIWLKTMADYDAMNQAWDAWVSGHKAPTRVCVEAPMAKPHYLIEVMVVAAVPE